MFLNFINFCVFYTAFIFYQFKAVYILSAPTFYFSPHNNYVRLFGLRVTLI